MNARHAGVTTEEYRIRSRVSGDLAEGVIGAGTKATFIKRRETENLYKQCGSRNEEFLPCSRTSANYSRFCKQRIEACRWYVSETGGCI